MANDRRTAAGQRATEVILAIFRANGLLLAAGDRIAAPDGLTSARWQILGAIDLAGTPLTVPQIARRMGLTRQSVHATVARLVAGGLVELVPNVDHRRSQLVRVTERGQAVADRLDDRQAVWVDELVDGVDDAGLTTTARTLEELCTRLETGPAAIAAPRRTRP